MDPAYGSSLCSLPVHAASRFGFIDMHAACFHYPNLFSICFSGHLDFNILKAFLVKGFSKLA